MYTYINKIDATDHYRFNIVYQIIEISTGKRYIGSHGTYKDNPITALKKYKSSTLDKCFAINQLLNRLNYRYEILSYHETRNLATKEEARIQRLYNAKYSDLYYNKAYADEGLNVAGKVNCIDPYGKYNFVNIDDDRIKSGYLKYWATGKKIMKDKDGNIYSLDINDNNPDFVGIAKGFRTVVDQYGNTFRVAINDPRIKTENLVSVCTGRSLTEEHKQKISNASKGENNAMYGRKHSEESKKKNAEKHLGKKASDKTRALLSSQRVGKLNSAAQPLIIDDIKFDTIKDASAAHGVSPKVVATRCKSTNKKWTNWFYIKKETT